MGLNDWIRFLWAAELVLELGLVVVLVVTNVKKRFPFFALYCLWALIGDVATYSLSRHLGAYFYVYLVNETVALVLALALIYEIFVQLFASYDALRRLATVTFRIVCAGLVLMGVIVLYAHAPIGARGIAAAVGLVEETYRILEVGLIMLLFLFSNVFGLRWRQQIFGIVLGLGIPAAIKLVAVAVGPHSYVAVGILNLATMVSYNVSCLIWFGYLVMPERVTAVTELPKTTQLEQWNQAIMELIHQ
jgi:hypothetical protein